jgi:hypothetical protein
MSGFAFIFVLDKIHAIWDKASERQIMATGNFNKPVLTKEEQSRIDYYGKQLDELRKRRIS